jgi:hypothetical protein
MKSLLAGLASNNLVVTTTTTVLPLLPLFVKLREGEEGDPARQGLAIGQ